MKNLLKVLVVASYAALAFNAGVDAANAYNCHKAESYIRRLGAEHGAQVTQVECQRLFDLGFVCNTTVLDPEGRPHEMPLPVPADAI